MLFSIRSVLVTLKRSVILFGVLLLFPVPQAEAMTGIPFGGVLASHSGKCIATESGSSMNAARIVQTGCLPIATSQWQVSPNGNYVQLINRQSSQCLAISGGAWLPGWQLVQVPCTGNESQLLSLVPQNGGYAMRFKRSGLCVDVFAANQADGAPLIQWICSSRSASQVFQFERGLYVGQAPLDIMSTQSGQCVNVDGDAVAAGAGVVQRRCTGAGSETWSFKPIGTSVAIVDKQSGQCLDVEGSSQVAGARAIQWPCKASANENQRWTLKPFDNGWQLVALHSGQCLKIGPAAAAGMPTQLIQSPCIGDATERWSFHVPTQVATWSPVIPTSVDPVAAANLPDGRILAWAADQPLWYNYYSTGLTHSEIIDPFRFTESVNVVTNTGHDMFCPGTAVLDDGRIFVNGGLNTKRTSLYDPATNTWSDGGNMNIGRGYEGTAMNADGSVLTLGGSFSGVGFGGRTGELWTRANTWTVLPGLPATGDLLTADAAGPFRSDNHFWLRVVSGARMLQVGPSKQMHWIDPKGNGGQGSIVTAGLRLDDTDSMNGNAVLFDVDKLIKLGGARSYGNSTATATSQLIDASGAMPTVKAIAPMAYPRADVNSVVLPNGQVVVVGGMTIAKVFSDDNTILVPELWDPASQVFERLPAMATPRAYHSVALLMSDGRIWVGGGGLCGPCNVNHANYEVLTPPYLLNPDGTEARRPSIRNVSDPVALLGSTLRVTTSEPVAGFALVRLSSVTHSLNNDQRRIPLAATTRDGQQYQMTLTNDPGILLPGFYMLFAMNARGVPSVAYTLRVATS